MNLLVNKILPATKLTNFYGYIVILSLIFSFIIFAYARALDIGALGTEGEKTYTISKALANASKPGFIYFICLALIYLFYLISTRGPKKYLTIRYSLIAVSFTLLISLLWFTPSFNKPLHYSLASIIFLCVFAYQIITYKLIYDSYKSDKIFFSFVSVTLLLVLIAMLVFACIGGETGSDVFAAFEILYAFLFGVNIVFLGFY